MVDEGDTAEVVVRYRVNDLAASVTLGVSALARTASPDDYALAPASLQISAGRNGVSGERSLMLTAVRDLVVSEGEETLTVRLAPPPGATGLDLGSGVEVVIAESGASPCAGVTARVSAPAGPPAAESAPGRDWIGTTLETEWWGAGLRSGFDLLGPYDPDRFDAFAPPQLGVRLLEWERETGPGTLRHSQRLSWLASAGDLRIGFRTEDGGCPGEPMLVCSPDRCALEP